MSRLVCVTTGVNTPTWVFGPPLPPRMPDWLKSPILDRLALKPPEMLDIAFASRVLETARSLMINMMMLLDLVGWLGELLFGLVIPIASTVPGRRNRKKTLNC